MLDFVVIGAARCGTTDFWRGVDSHPEICTPMDKERGLFNSDDRYAKGIEAYVGTALTHARPGQRLGTVTPNYMAARHVETVVARMHDTIPDAKLIALLRDPIDRAVSQFRSALRKGRAHGPTFDDHVRAVAAQGRDAVSAGAYGEILGRYLEAFSRTQFLILFTEDLEQDPDAVYRRAFEHIGVDTAYSPPQRSERLNVGGTTRRASPDSVALIEQHMDAHVWPHLPDRRERRRAFNFWLEYLWNVVPDDEGKHVSPQLRAELEQRFAADAEVLRDLFAVEPPWCATWRARGHLSSRP